LANIAKTLNVFIKTMLPAGAPYGTECTRIKVAVSATPLPCAAEI